MADPTTVEDVIAEAVGLALPRSLQPVGASLREPPEFGGTITGYGQQIVDAITPAVVAAIRGATVAQQAQLIGGTVERADLKRLTAEGRFADVPCSRVVTEWRAEP